MAIHEVTRSCGHIEAVQIRGPHSARAAQARHAGRSACEECRRAGRTQVAAWVAADYPDLPALRGGTDRQREWATTIRADALAGLEPAIRDASAGKRPALGDDDVVALVTLCRTWLLDHDATTWWIEQRPDRAVWHYVRTHWDTTTAAAAAAVLQAVIDRTS